MPHDGPLPTISPEIPLTSDLSSPRRLGTPASRSTMPIKPDELAARLVDLPIAGSPETLALACVEVARKVVGRARLVLPPSPVPIAIGDSAEGLTLLARFPAPGGEGELWTSDVDLSPSSVATLEDRLAWIWTVQRERAAQERELDQLRFHLAALQQATHTLAIVRGAEETEQLVLDSVKEVFFAWWAALFRKDEEGLYARHVVRSLRGEEIAGAIPSDVVLSSIPRGGGMLLPGDAPIRDFLPPDAAVLAPLEVDGAITGLLVLGSRMTEAPYEPHDGALLRALSDVSAIALRNAELMDQLRTQAMRDALTGCMNRRGFDERMAIEFSRARRYQRSLSLVTLDIDGFKAFNDDYGHEVGDHALRRVGRTLHSTFRVTDSACRLGGEEFALIFPETEKNESARLAEILRAAIAALEPDALLPRRVTASFGVATYPEDATDVEGLLRAADRALYRAKANGRNRIEIAGAAP